MVTALLRKDLKILAPLLLNCGVVQRWPDSQSVRVIGADQEEIEFIDNVFDELNHLIRGSKVEFHRIEKGEAAITIAIRPRADWATTFGNDIDGFEELMEGPGELHGMAYRPPNFPETGWVFIDSGVSPEQRRSALIHEILHIVGVPGHNVWDVASAVYIDLNATPTEFSKSDRALLKLLYLDLAVGDGEDEVTRAFLEMWARAVQSGNQSDALTSSNQLAAYMVDARHIRAVFLQTLLLAWDEGSTSARWRQSPTFQIVGGTTADQATVHIFLDENKWFNSRVRNQISADR